MFGTAGPMRKKRRADGNDWQCVTGSVGPNNNATATLTNAGL
jgi:hypothetical protein